ncbi:MAG: hypothetical protein JXM71_05280 [Spirochaetales bacterium]|nr:hypothetical protein [Spirochaetales bacterium]
MTLPPWFERFLSPLADRSGELVAALTDAGVHASVLDIDGGRFVLAWPRGAVRDRRYRIKIISAHHDRVPGTPGALDNSAACLQLARFLSGDSESFNTVVVFTDREELGGSSPTGQGSFALGTALATMGIGTPMVFPLDVTGRGDALVLSRAINSLATMRDGIPGVGVLAAAIDAMADTVTRMMAGRVPVYLASIPFGEDIGYIGAGLPALTVTVLPRGEAEALVAGDGFPAWASTAEPGSRMPATWAHLHGSGDTPRLYTDEAFDLMERFLSRLSALRVPEPVATGKKVVRES